ncbi:MAG: aconitate hydratase AcnA [Magnetococcales bacterium]|nr:aconitate hydratase AcnA [Magnetococcales bacterium]
MHDSFKAQSMLKVGTQSYRIYRLDALTPLFNWRRLPISHRILLENLLRHEDGETITREEIERVAAGDQSGAHDIAFYPARILLQDFTGVPALVDLAAMRDAVADLGGDAQRINPLRPTDLVIDHSVQVDAYAKPEAFNHNADLEMGRNRERYTFLRWGQNALDNLRIAPPDRGIVHQVNLEHLSQVVFTETVDGVLEAFPDTLVGTDSHTPMINSLGVLGWGVGGIEAEAAMLGEPLSIRIPPVTGVRLSGQLREGVTATDLVLTLTERLRRKGVVGRFIEFIGPALDQLSLADRATIANMTPEFGATSSLFPIDDQTLHYLRLSNRDEDQIALIEAYARLQGLFRDLEREDDICFDALLELDLSEVEPSLAGPRRPQDRVALSQTGQAFQQAFREAQPQHADAPRMVDIPLIPDIAQVGDGSIVIAAITSCTNTSNPAVMVAAGLLAAKAHARGLKVSPHVKTSLAPGSRVVMEYLEKAHLVTPLEELGFHLVGFGCTTCIGNSGPLHPSLSQAIHADDLQVCSVLSGNRNFEGRIHADVAQNYLASPPLVVAFALAGRIDIDMTKDPIGKDAQDAPVYLRDIWPSNQEVTETLERSVDQKAYRSGYAGLFAGTPAWNALPAPEGARYDWQPDSSYIKRPPYLEGVTRQPTPPALIQGARALLFLGDSVTTDHISPAGSIGPDSAAGRYLIEQGIPADAFNSYGARRGNHEVMMRGTFANVRLQNRLTPDHAGGWTIYQPTGERLTVYAAAQRYREEATPMVVVAGREYGSGSSRDWAAKGPHLLGIKAVLAVSYERIHRTNLVGMGILPLQFQAGDTPDTLGLTGHEQYDIALPAADATAADTLTVHARSADGTVKPITLGVRIDTHREWQWYRHGGILPFVLRRMVLPDEDR